MTIGPASYGRDFSIFSGLPSIISYNYRMHHLLTNSFSSIVRSTDLIKGEDSDLLNSLIDQFDSEAKSLSHPIENDDLSECIPNAPK